MKEKRFCDFCDIKNTQYNLESGLKPLYFTLVMVLCKTTLKIGSQVCSLSQLSSATGLSFGEELDKTVCPKIRSKL